MSLWENTPTCLCPPNSSKAWRRAPSSTRGQILPGSPFQVHQETYFLKHVCTLFPDSQCVPSFTRTAGQMDFSQVSCPLMTPPISPAALVPRGSVINQGPTTGRPLTSSSSTTCPSSSSSCLSSLSAMTQPAPCSSYPETLYQCLPQTSCSYFAPGSDSASNYQPALRSAYVHRVGASCS